MRRVTSVLLCLLFLAACSNDKDRPSASDTTTTTALPVSTTATPTTKPSGPASTPQLAADGLYDAWVNNDKEAASRYAKPQAIEKLFAHPHTDDSVEYHRQPCEPQGGQFVCSWFYEGGAMQMTVEAWPGGGYVVDSVTYLAD
jgi:hypothetical protein